MAACFIVSCHQWNEKLPSIPWSCWSQRSSSGRKHEWSSSSSLVEHAVWPLLLPISLVYSLKRIMIMTSLHLSLNGPWGRAWSWWRWLGIQTTCVSPLLVILFLLVLTKSTFGCSRKTHAEIPQMYCWSVTRKIVSRDSWTLVKLLSQNGYLKKK